MNPDQKTELLHRLGRLAIQVEVAQMLVDNDELREDISIQGQGMFIGDFLITDRHGPAPGFPQSRTDYIVTVSAREKEACERWVNLKTVAGDFYLVAGVAEKIAQLPKIVVDRTGQPER